mgnify:CR=1 FL=1
MARVYNFSAGPSMLPEEVLTTAASEMLEFGESGQSVMEMSHRSKEYQAIIDTAEADLREIMNIPDNYEVLFLQGGASTQFAMVPLNLMTKNGKADYRKISDMELCTELNNLARNRYGRHSVYQLSLKEKQEIAEYLFRIRHIDEAKIRRCLILPRHL